MENKVFLGKYRVAADEIAQVTAEPATVAMSDAGQQVASARLYRGVEIDSGQEVNLEVVPSAGFKQSVRDKLEAEAAAARNINHINIPELYDFGIEAGQLIYVTEYFDGTSAENWVNQHGPMPTGAVLRIGLQVMSAMGAAAFHKISHHAINPANLLLVPGQTPEGDWPLVKVLHFIGVAPTFSGGDMSVAAFDKSTHYASPEQLQGKPVDFRSEIYSLAATMWFLLTGAPPLMAPQGPMAMQPTTIGLAVDKLKGMPKRVRRLLAQMLSVDPAARPQDPLAVYRQIQDCVAQVERRESMAKRLGVPFLSGSNAAALPTRRSFPTKLVALAAIIVAIATIASIAVASYLRHERIRQAEEPIGTPIGVTQPVESAPPVTASAPTVAPAPAQPAQSTQTTVAQKEQAAPAMESAPTIKPLPTAPEKTEPAVIAQQNQPPPAPASTAAVAANNQAVAPPPAKPEVTVAPEPPKVAEHETKPVVEPSETAAPKVAATNAEPPVERTTSAPRKQRPVEAHEEKPKSEETEVAAATARPVTPEVRRAEPAPPAEGDEEEVAPATEKKLVTTTSKPKKERKPNREPEEQAIPRAVPVEEDADEVAEAPMPQLPHSRTRAKFIGVTADGNWMFSLPNKKVVIVPAPPGG
jgi:serine/threonine protein kinase